MPTSADGPADDSTQILDGVRVLDLSPFVTGGFCSLMLANQGAEVIKIEQPDVGHDNRHSGAPFVNVDGYDGAGKTASNRGESPYFWTVDYDETSIELNLKSDEGVDLLYELVETSDVFIENFRPGTAVRLGIGYEALRERNDEIVYCSIAGFGESGSIR